MTIKDIELAMAEDLRPDIREQHGLPDTGMVVVETLNSDLRQEYRQIDNMRDYLLSLGGFTEADMEQE